MVKESNKRIAKNTAMMYVRMFFTMAITLYTSRIVLQTLGVVDFGVYTAIGSVVTAAVILTSAFSNATQRFITYEMASGDALRLRQVFNMSVMISFMLVLLILILAETVGLWFVSHRLIIPPERHTAALWLYQFSLFALILTILQAPYNAAIVAHEDLKIYAYVSILEVTLKLVSVYLLLTLQIDKLILYSALLAMVSFLVISIYRMFCLKKYPESRFLWYWDKTLFKSMTGFASWNMYGSFAFFCMDQGLNVLLNLFFGPAVNTSRGLAIYIKSAIYNFSYSFQVAVNPQIVKSYATKDVENMRKLFFQSSKFSYYLLFFLILPMITETEFVMHIWLKEVPQYAISFTRLTLLLLMVDCFSGLIGTCASATQRIKLFSLASGTIMIIGVFVAWFFLKLGYPPQSVFIVNIATAIIALFTRLLVLEKLVEIPAIQFISKVLLPVSIVTVCGAVIPFVFLTFFQSGVLRFLLVGFSSVIFNAVIMYFLGINMEERVFIRGFVVKKIKSIRHGC